MNSEKTQVNSGKGSNLNTPFKDGDSMRVSVLSEALPYIQRFAN